MNFPRWFSTFVWLVFPFCAGAFLVWSASAGMRRADYVSGLGNSHLTEDPASPTGYAGGIRRLAVPGLNTDSYHWIIQTQQVAARGDWRMRTIDYQNAPFGREVSAPSAYRRWLGFVAWIDRSLSGRSTGLSIEHAALFADPLLQLLLLAGLAVFVWWRLGALPAALLSAGTATLFPFATEFVPGSPNARTLSLACAVWSALLLVAGLEPGRMASLPADAEKRRRFWFALAGVAGGLGLWVDAAMQIPVIVGIGLGSLLAAWVARSDRNDAAPELPWRAWALAGALTGFAACWIEYGPAQFAAWQLRVNHPLYALAWLGMGELLRQFSAGIQRGKAAWNLPAVGWTILGLLAVAAAPVVAWKTHHPGIWAGDLFSFRLTRLPDGPAAANFWAWLLRDGITATVCATILPGLLLVPAIGMMVRRATGTTSRLALAIASGPVLVAAGMGCRQLAWWSAFDALWLVLLAVVAAVLVTPAVPRFARWIGGGVIGTVFVLGFFQLLPIARGDAAQAVTGREAKGLIERDLAHWLARQAGPAGAIVLAPPTETTAACYYGGLRGVATLDWENKDGFGAAVRIAGASTVEEAMELVRRREITHLIIPSWDNALDDYARGGLGQIEGSFIDRLHQWALPPWLRPVPYQLPALPGFEGQSVVVLQVVDDQDPAAAASRLAECFLEMGQIDRAVGTAQSLRRFPADLGAWVARAQVDIARGDDAALAESLKVILPRLAAKGDRSLPWDRRVSLAVVLARGHQPEIAKQQLQRCVADADEAKLRMLTASSLYRLMVLSKGLGVPLGDSKLHEYALSLLPPDVRARF